MIANFAILNLKKPPEISDCPEKKEAFYLKLNLNKMCL